MMYVILDTSVWIEYFKGKEGYFDTCQELIEKGKVRTVDVIFAELLQGALNQREATLIQNYYELIPKIEIDQPFIIAGNYSRKERLISRGIGLIDSVIITATIQSGSKLWTLDKKILAFMNDMYLFDIKDQAN